MEKQQIFDVILLLARPGAGKSEIIRFLKQLDSAARKKLFHLGKLNEIDDFPMLWTWFEEDALLTEMGHPRLHTNELGYFSEVHFWDLLIRRIGLDWEKGMRDSFKAENGYSTIVEFSRGSQHGGFKRAFDYLNRDMLKKAAILYVNVSWEESLRKNRSRFNPDKPDSILEHGLPDHKLEFMYKESDCADLAGEKSGHLIIQGIKVPYAVLENEDDVTTPGGEALGERLKMTMEKLWVHTIERNVKE